MTTRPPFALLALALSSLALVASSPCAHATPLPVTPCSDLDFNNDGDWPTPLDLEDLERVTAGAACPTCDSPDFNADGDWPTQADVEAFARVMAGGPCEPDGKTMDWPRDPAGWSLLPVAADARVVYIAPWGSDANPGTDASAPLATWPAAYAAVRDGHPDRIRVLGLEIAGPIANQYGGWDKRGRSATQPMVIEAWPIERASRVTISVPATRTGLLIQGDGTQGRLAVRGLEFRQQAQDLSATCIRVFSLASDVLIEDVACVGFSGGVQFIGQGEAGRQTNIILRRSIIEGGIASTGHGGGLYATTVTGLRIEECVFYRCGWPQSVFSHNAYIRPDVTGTATGNVTAYAAATGLQIRGNAFDALENAALVNPIGITVGHDQMDYPREAWTGRAVGNFILGGLDIATTTGAVLPRGFGFGQSRGGSGAIIADNVIGPMTGGTTPASLWLAGPNAAPPAAIAGNVLFEPTGRFQRIDRPGAWDYSTSRKVANIPPFTVADYIREQPQSSQPPPLDAATTGPATPPELLGIDEFLTRARAQSRSTWHDAWTGRALARWTRQRAQAHPSGIAH